MRLPPALLLVLATACTHAPAPKPAPAEPPFDLTEPPPNPAYEQRVRETMLERSDGVQDCHASSADDLPVGQPLMSSALYVSPQLAYLPRSSGLPALAAFERCVLQHLTLYELPPQVGPYSAAWVRIHFRPASAPTQTDASLTPLFTRGQVQAFVEVSGTAPRRVTLEHLAPGVVPDRARDVVGDVGERRDMLTRPVELSGSKINYTQTALVKRVQGIMRVKCVLTWMGTLQDCRILQPLPYMERSVLGALLTKRYTPVTYEGHAVNIDYTFTIQLRIPQG
jgi:hypothetical protein